MTIGWLLAGAVILTAGSIWTVKGLTAVAGRMRISPLISGLIAVFGMGAGPGLVLAAVSGVMRQSSFLVMMLIGAGAYNTVLYSGLLCLIQPCRVPPVIWKREFAFLMLALLVFVVAGRETFAAGHPDAELGTGGGMLFLILFLAEIVWLPATSMEGYRRKRAAAGWPLLFALLTAGAGVCAMVCGGYLTVDRAVESGVLLKQHPSFWGFCVCGAALGIFGFLPALREARAGRETAVSCLWGPASLTVTGGLGLACLTAPVQISYTAVLAAVFGMVLLLLYGLIGVLGRRIGRIGAVLLLAGYAGTVMLLLRHMLEGFY